MLKKVFLVVSLSLIVCMLSGCKNVFKTDTPSVEEKVDEEMEYLDSEIIAMLNSLNSIIYTNYKVVPTEVKQSNTASNSNVQMNESGSSQGAEQKESLETSGESSSSTEQQSNGQSASSQGSSGGSGQSSSGGSQQGSGNKSDIKTLKMEPNTILSVQNTNIDWLKTQSDIEIFYTAWITAKIDLKDLGVPDELLDKFSRELNNTTLAIKNQDKIKTMDGLVNMYSVLSEFANSYCGDRHTISTIETKRCTLTAYNYIENANWEEAKNQISEAEQKFEYIKNSDNIEANKKVDIARVSVLIKEMKDSLELQNKEIALLKYKDLIQELSIID